MSNLGESIMSNQVAVDAHLDIFQPIAGKRLNLSLLQARSHAAAADHAEKMNNWLGVSLVLLSAVLSTTAFASFADLGRYRFSWDTVTFIMSLVVTAIAGLQAFFNFSAKGQDHAETAAKLFALQRAFEGVMVLAMIERLTAINQFNRLSKELDEVLLKAPRVPISAQQKIADELEAERPKGTGGGGFRNMVQDLDRG